MIDALCFVAAELKNTSQTFANDGGSQVTDVHFLGNVGGGEIDDNTFWGDTFRG